MLDSWLSFIGQTWVLLEPTKRHLSHWGERSGKYKPNKKGRKTDWTGTKKCECPFRLRGRPIPNDGRWRLTVVNGYHNHGRVEVMVGHPYTGRLNPHKKLVVEDKTKNQVNPGPILLGIKERDPENVSTIKTIYNKRYTYRKSIRYPRTEMQHLIKMLED